MKKTISLLLLLFVMGSFLTKSAQAFTMSNLFFILHLGNLNSIAGTSSGPNNKLTITVGELGAGYYSGSNWQLCAGFYGGINCKSPGLFSFTISSTDIDFGILDPNTPIDRTNILTVNNAGLNSSSYFVTASENHSLQMTTSSTTIPDTTCDNGLCTSLLAGPWVLHSGSSLTYGFGYRCDNVFGSDCGSGFSNPNYFKQFAASSSAQVVMTGPAGKNRQVQITYRLNTSPSQAAGVYTNAITYIATPTF